VKVLGYKETDPYNSIEFSRAVDFDSNKINPEISMDAMNGVTSYHTIRINGHVGKKTIHILLDSGSTHNFWDVNLAKGLVVK